MENENCNHNVVEIFWTGGFDSTFRIVQLSRCNVMVQPYYLSDQRKSERYELEAITKILDALRMHSSTKCTFKPLRVIRTEDRVENKEITDAFKRVLEKEFFGSQYEWLAQFALFHPGIELSVHKDDKAINVINKFGALKEINQPMIGINYMIDKTRSSKDIQILFQNYRLPLADYTKLGMMEYFIANGYKEIMNYTWFCYTPINGKPCGKCNPCVYSIEEGMKTRFSKGALLRYKLYKSPAIAVLKKCKRRITSFFTACIA